MRLAISNIGWRAEDDASIPAALRAAGADAIEVAPSRLFADPAGATPADIAAVRDGWRAAGLPVISMQALLFGRGDLTLFGPPEAEEALVAYLSRIIALAGALGAGPLVFGSPKNRLKGGMDFGEARGRAVPVLRRLGDTARAAGCVLCLEPNATGYGCDFMTTLEEAASVARVVDHPAVGLIADTGNMQMMGEPPGNLEPVADLVRHLHLSMPNLDPVTEACGFLREVLGVARRAGYAGDVTIEMRAPAAGGDAVGQAVAALTSGRTWINQR
jgi:D-psicose/D-tagatose/L-ribulose 3-epimerase